MRDLKLERLHAAANDAARAWSAAVGAEERARDAYTRAHHAVIDYQAASVRKRAADDADTARALELSKRWSRE